MQMKLNQLTQILHSLESVVVAYSGGVDSTLLLKLAHQRLGQQAIAVTAVSASLPGHERRLANEIACQIGARHDWIESHEIQDSRYSANPANRCYYCKTNVFADLRAYADAHGFRHIIDGTNADDVGDHRPGREAARQHGVRSPLQEAGFTKMEIRQLARALDLPNWDKPAAACLASRVPYGTPITLEVLSQVEKAELALLQLGFNQLRVRHHESIARLEVPVAEFERVLSQRTAILQALQQVGYAYITLDLAGFRSGSLNEVISHGR